MKYAFLYPDNIWQKLEFDKILQLLRERCASELGVRCVDRIKVSADIEFIRMALTQAHEMKEVYQRGRSFSTEDFLPLEEELHYLSIENSSLTEEQFFILKKFLRNIEDFFSFFTKEENHYPALRLLFKEAVFNDELLKEIDHTISDEGVVRSGVYPALDAIRRNIKAKEKELDRAFAKILAEFEKNGWLASGGESIKNGRRVLAVLSENKRKIKGIIHDESATGKAVFMEPDITLEISNELFELKQEERREIYSILRELSTQIRPYIDDLVFYQKLAGLFDFVIAKTRLAIQLNASMPELKPDKKIRYLRAVHPLLYLHNTALKKETIPLEFSLDENNRILVISGPNAGGKSVALKTVGLVQMMLQAGLLVPVFPDSVFTVFNKIFVDLGDEQSIDNELSTYSSKLRHMKIFLEKADANSLFFIDEFGTGTDPKSGGAIAEALLEELTRKKSFGVLNTHYSNLKIFAANTQGIINGNMLFDTESLNPLYRLQVGQPGSSYAFEIAQKIGLPKKIISSARKKTGEKFRDYDALLASLETDKHAVAVRKKELDDEQKRLNALVGTYTNLKASLEENKKALLTEAKRKASAELDRLKLRFEKLVDEFEKKSKSKKTNEKLREEFHLQQHRLQKEIEKIQVEEVKKLSSTEIKQGMVVRMQNTRETGVVEEVRKNKALVSFGSLRTLMPISELEAMPASAAPAALKKQQTDLLKMAEEFRQEIDLRGMRVEEAIAEVEKQLDKALLLSIHRLRILHGKGNGILRSRIRELLKKYSFVKNYHSPDNNAGGDGITEVELE